MRRRAPISSRGFADLSQVGETKLLHDEVLYQLRIISSPKSSFPLRLSSCKELLSVVQSASKDAHLSVSLLSGVRDGLRANENEPVLVEALLSVLLVFMAREQFNGYTHASPILSLDLLRQVLVLAITLAPKNRLEHPLQESSEEQTSKPYRDEKGQEETKTGGRLKRKFSSSSASYSPEKIPTGLHQSPAVESAKRAIDLVTWPLVNESFIGCDKQYPSVFILASVFVNRFFMLAIERLNSLSSGAIQRSSNMDGDDDEVEGEDADILERSSTTSGGNKSMYSSESGTQDNVQPSIRNIEDAKQFLERAQTLLTATLPEASSTSPIGQSSYMEKMLILLGLHIKDLMRVLSKQKYNVDMRSQYSRVWLFLGILESSCFNFPSNQIIISKIHVARSSSSATGMSSNFTISTLLMKCIQFFAPIAIGACNQPLIDSAHLEDLVVEDRHFAALFVDFPFLKGGNEVSSDCDSLTTVELFLSCLKALVTITNHCHEIAVPIIETEDMMKWNCGLLVHSLHWKQQLQLSRKGSSGEKMLERYIFDWALFVMALTTNLLEACSETFRTAIFEDLCYQSIDSIIGSSPLKPFFTKAVTHVTLHNSMVNFFVDVLLAESEIFIEDLVATDEKLARNDGMLSSSSQNDSCDEDVPVAELIFTAHLCLMLHTCLFGKISSDKTGVVKPSGGYVLNSAKVSQSILSRLPRKSWWLCIRILKGYLALQGQSGVLLVENFIPSLVTISHLEYLSNLSFDLYPMFAQNQAIKAYSQSTNNFSQHSSISSTSDNSVVSDWLPTAASGQGKVPNAPVTTKRYTYGLNSVSRTVEAVNDICFVEKWDISKSCFSELEKSKSSNESSASPDKSPTKCGSKLSLSPSPIRKSHKQTSKTSVSSWEDDELFSFKSSSPKRSASKIHTPPSRVDVDSSSSMDGSIKQVSKSPILEKIPLMTHVQDALPPLRKGIYEAKMKFSGDIEEKRTNNVFGFPIIQRDPKDGWKAKRKFAK